MKITGWTWGGNPDYDEINGSFNCGDCPYDRGKLRDLIVHELRERGYKFCGFYHQDGDYGAPIIDNKYVVGYTYRSWGGIIEDSYPLHSDDNMSYCYWAWCVPDGEKQVVPNPDDYSL